MKSRKIYMVFNVLFALAVFGLFFFYIFGQSRVPLQKQYFDYMPIACVGLCFLLSLVTIRLDAKKIFLLFTLAFYVVAHLFLFMLKGNYFDLIGYSSLCVSQFFLCLYTVYINFGTGRKVTNIAVRIAVSFITYFVLSRFYALSVIQTIQLICLINLLLSFLILICYLKSEALLCLGCLALLASGVFFALKTGGIELFNLSGKFVQFVTTTPIEFYCYIPALFVVGTASVWTKK